MGEGTQGSRAPAQQAAADAREARPTRRFRLPIGRSTGIGHRPRRESRQDRRDRQELADRLRIAVDIAGLGTWEYDLETGAVDWDEGTYQLHGVAPGSVRTAADALAMVHPDDVDRVRTAIAAAAEATGPFRLEHRVVAPDGSVRWLSQRGSVLRRDDGSAWRLVGMSADVTDRRAAEEVMLVSEQRYRLLQEMSTDMISVTTGPDRIFRYVSRASEEIFGYPPEELVGRSAHEFFHPDELPRLRHTLGHDRRLPDVFTVQQRLRHRDGHWVWVEARVRVVRDPATGDVVERHASTRDISERRRAEQALAHQAAHDRLTGLPNRFLLMDRVSVALSRLSRQKGYVALLLVDLDRFTSVNESFGHATGDDVLTQMAARMRSTLRVGDTAARLGGDEFVVLCEALETEDEVRRLASRLLDSLGRPVTADGNPIVVTASIGLAVADAHVTANELLARADAARREAKRQGRGRIALADVTTANVRRHRAQLATGLRRALDESELVVEYQPLIDARTEDVVGAEALVRWRSAGGGREVAPRDFVTVAEDTGLIAAIGRWVLREVCRQLVEWRSAGLPPIPVWVNVSAAQLTLEEDFAGFVHRELELCGIAGKLLGCEITESVLVQEHDAVTATLRRLRDLDISIAIDDFGTGYSSLAYVHRLAVDVVKIDKAFVDSVALDMGSEAVVRAVIDLSHALALTTVAEGVETREQLDRLRLLGCDQIQGHLYSRSMSGAQFPAYVRSLSAVAR